MAVLSRIFADPNLFPKIIIFLYFCSSIRYAWQGDYGRMTYWVAAALITISVTFMIRH